MRTDLKRPNSHPAEDYRKNTRIPILPRNTFHVTDSAWHSTQIFPFTKAFINLAYFSFAERV